MTRSTKDCGMFNLHRITQDSDVCTAQQVLQGPLFKIHPGFSLNWSVCPCHSEAWWRYHHHASLKGYQQCLLFSRRIEWGLLKSNSLKSSGCKLFSTLFTDTAWVEMVQLLSLLLTNLRRDLHQWRVILIMCCSETFSPCTCSTLDYSF